MSDLVGNPKYKFSQDVAHFDHIEIRTLSVILSMSVWYVSFCHFSGLKFAEMYFDDKHACALMEVYEDICFKMQFEDKISLTADLVLHVVRTNKMHIYCIKTGVTHY